MQTNDLGLVPGKAIKTFDIYRAGQLCGFEPAVAARLRQKGLWRPTDAGNAASIDASNEEQEVEDDNGGGMFLVALEEGTLQIPYNWRERKATDKKAWATSIYGDKVAKVEEADIIIADAVKDQEDALSSTE